MRTYIVSTLSSYACLLTSCTNFTTWLFGRNHSFTTIEVGEEELVPINTIIAVRNPEPLYFWLTMNPKPL